MKGKKPQKQLLQFVMLSLLSIVSVLVMANESYAAFDCTSCHGTSPTSIRPNDSPTGTRDVATGAFKGSHEKHLVAVPASQAACTVCHNNVGYLNRHRDGKIDMASGVDYSKGVFFNQTSVPVLGTCATASCHIAATDLVKVSPTWGATATCNSCHDATPSTGAHTKHLASAYHLPTCGDCHTGATAGLSGGANHLNGTNTISVAAGMGYPTSTAKHASGTYTTTGCSTTACHSSGQSANGASATPVYATVAPTWGNAASGACGTCHATTGMNTGRHANHILIDDNCGNCHTGSSTTAYASTNHVDGSISVAAGLGYTAGGTPGNGYGTCSAASCHAPFTNVAPKVTRIWTAGGISCSACHESNQITGAHNKHYAVAAIGAGNCDYCHTSSGDLTHADGQVNVNFIAAPVDKHASNAYNATCTTACHAVYGATGSSPNWGVVNAAPGCTSCHLTAIPATGLHTKHLAATGGTCTDCHAAGYTASAVNATDHANGTVQVVGQGYPPNVAKHAVGAPNYFTCSTAKCHDAYGTTGVSASWNTTTTSCASCHAATPTTGSHTSHLTHISNPPTPITCASCHVGATAGTNGGTKHIDNFVNVSTAGGGHLKSVAKHPIGGYMSCTATCHNGSKFTAPAVAWGGTLNCASCHAYPPDPAGTHAGVSAVTPGSCNSCHSEVKTTTVVSTPLDTAFATPTLHMNDVVDGGKCDACHGYPPVLSMTGKGTIASYSGAKAQNYLGGGGVHDVEGHLSKNIRQADGFSPCLTCHPSGATHNQGFPNFSSSKVQVVVLAKYKFNAGSPITYSAFQRGSAAATGTCSNVSCHFQASPKWATDK